MQDMTRLTPRDAQLAGAAIATMLRMHDAAASLWPLEPVSHRDDLERLAAQLAPEFGTADIISMDARR